MLSDLVRQAAEQQILDPAEANRLRERIWSLESQEDVDEVWEALAREHGLLDSERWDG